jgi:multifunctional methyltransferase subunit TRM112
MVRLITHNLLSCHVKGCDTNNFPLHFKNVELEIKEAEYNPDFIQGFVSKLDWNALVGTAKEV